jgi:endonuclease YncB( thermonuclease family)
VVCLRWTPDSYLPALMWLLAAAAPTYASPATRPEVAAVHRVTSGTRLSVAGYGPVRLYGITVPARLDDGHPNRLASEARSRLAALVLGRYVRIEPVGAPAAARHDLELRSRTSRRAPSPVSAIVWLETGTLVNEELVRAGLARLSYGSGRGPSRQRRHLGRGAPNSTAPGRDPTIEARLIAAESEARAKRRGIWAHLSGVLR